MPVYEYECQHHGVFEVIKSLVEHADPALCPECDQPAGRILSRPYLARVAHAERVARDRNERSQYEPRVAPSAAGGSACAHGHGASDKRGAKPSPTSQKLKRYTGKRPWVIEHG